MESDSRLILCRNCSDWIQAPNPEQGSCTYGGRNETTNYDTRCLLDLYEKVKTPDLCKFKESVVFKCLETSGGKRKVGESLIKELNDKGLYPSGHMTEKTLEKLKKEL